MLGACSSDDVTVIEKVANNSTAKSGIPIGLSFGQLDNATTRMSAVNTQANKNFLGIDELSFIPFASTGESPVKGSNVSFTLNKSLSATVTNNWGGPSAYFAGDNNDMNALVYFHETIPSGTSSFLVYGHAPGGGPTATQASDKFAHGSTIMDGYDNTTNYSGITAKDITFAPDPILFGTNVSYTKANKIIEYLNSILTTKTHYDALTYYGTWRYNNNNSGTVIKVDNSKTGDLYIDGRGEIDSDEYIQYENVQTPRAGVQNVQVTYKTSLKIPADLKEAFDNFKNSLNGAPCSSSTVSGALNVFYQSLGSYNPNATPQNGDDPVLNNSIYNSLIEAICNNIEDVNYGVTTTTSFVDVSNSVFKDFPSEYNLPDGIAYIRYNGTSFELVTRLEENSEIVPDFNILAVEKYSYPAQLYYYSNTPIKTTIEEFNTEDEIKAKYNKNTWNGESDATAVLPGFTYGETVTIDVTAVALVEPLNYGSAKLQFTVKTESSIVKDSENHEFNASDLKVTSIFVGSQHPQGFNFRPTSVTESFVAYDKDTNPVSLSASPSSYFHTLLLPTGKDESVYIILELENNSTNTISGLKNEENVVLTHIPPKSKFYLTGLLVPPGAGNLPDGVDSHLDGDIVFQSDFVTTVNLTVKNLSGSYPIVPDINSPALVLGLATHLDWQQATPKSQLLK